VSATLYATDVLAKSGEAAKAGPMAFAVILLLCVACYFLFKSMSRHLKRVREQFPKDGAEPGQPPAAPPTAPGAQPGA